MTMRRLPAQEWLCSVWQQLICHQLRHSLKVNSIMYTRFLRKVDCAKWEKYKCPPRTLIRNDWDPKCFARCQLLAISFLPKDLRLGGSLTLFPGKTCQSFLLIIFLSISYYHRTEKRHHHSQSPSFVSLPLLNIWPTMTVAFVFWALRVDIACDGLHWKVGSMQLREAPPPWYFYKCNSLQSCQTCLHPLQVYLSKLRHQHTFTKMCNFCFIHLWT